MPVWAKIIIPTTAVCYSQALILHKNQSEMFQVSGCLDERVSVFGKQTTLKLPARRNPTYPTAF